MHNVSDGALVRYLKLGVENEDVILAASMDEASSR